MADEAAPFSFQGEQAKMSAIAGIRDKVTQGVIDNWWALHKDDAPEPTSDNVRRKVEEIIHPPAGKDGKIPAYVKMDDGTKVPTADTIEEYGNAAGRAVDKGTTVDFGFGNMGGLGQLLGMIFTAIQALFSWISGEAGSFTEAYANITKNNISGAFEKEMGAMGPEHQEFIAKNKLVEQGKQKISEAVDAQAFPGTTTPAEPAFDIDSYKRPERPVTKKAEEMVKSLDPAATPEEKIGKLLQGAIDNTKSKFDKPLKESTPEQKEQLAKIETQLLEKGKKLAMAADAPKTAKEFSARLMKEVGVDLAKAPADEKEKKQLEKIKSVIEYLDAQIQGLHPYINEAATGKALTAEEKTAAQATAVAKTQEADKNLAATAKQDVIDKTAKAVNEAIRDTVVAEVDKTQKEWSLAGRSITWNVSKELKAVRKYADHPPAAGSPEAIELDAAKKRIHDYAAKKGMAPNEAQSELIAKLTGEAVAEQLEHPQDKKALVDSIRKGIESKILQNEKAISKLGPSFDTLDTAGDVSVFYRITHETADKIRDNAKLKDGQGAYDALKTAQDIMSKPGLASAMGKADGGLGAAGVTGGIEQKDAPQAVPGGKQPGGPGISRGGNPTRTPAGPGALPTPPGN